MIAYKKARCSLKHLPVCSSLILLLFSQRQFSSYSPHEPKNWLSNQDGLELVILEPQQYTMLLGLKHFLN